MDDKALLEWYLAAGVDEAIGDTPNNYFIQKAEIIPPPPSADKQATGDRRPATTALPLHLSPSAAIEEARKLADCANNIAELEQAVRSFNGCALKKTATKTVFASGNPAAKIMIIGEEPDADEDLTGIPFSGENGEMLDKMLAAIGLSRETSYITDIIFWRPPGNRRPTESEIAICLPFIEKHIAVAAPKILVLTGGTAVSSLLKQDASLSRLRGKLYEYNNIYLSSPIKTAILYHPSYLRRQPLHKKQAWQDLLAIKANL